MPTVICAGLITLDAVYDLTAYPEEGSKVQGERGPACARWRRVAGGNRDRPFGRNGPACRSCR